LIDLISELSHISNITTVEALAYLSRDDLVSVSPGSDSVGSSVEDEPLPVVSSVGVSDSESILLGTEVLSPVDSSVELHSGLDLELDAVSKWVRWEVISVFVKVPGLTEVFITVIEGDVSVVGVTVSVNTKTFTSSVSEISFRGFVVSDSLVDLSLVLSDDSCNTDSEVITILI